MQKLPLQHIRHSEILQRLHSGELLSITELSKEWDTNTKNIQRDFKKLMEGDYGVVRAEDGKRFKIDHSGKTTSTASSTAIKLLDSVAKDMGKGFHNSVTVELQKITSSSQTPFYAHIGLEDISQHMKVFKKLEDAIIRNKIVSLEYKTKNIKKHEDIKPLKIVIFDGFFYLYCQKQDFTMKLYVKNISNVSISQKSFIADDELLKRLANAHNVWFETDAEPFSITLHVEKDIVKYFQRNPINKQPLKIYKDGSADLQIDVTSEGEVFSLVKRWLPDIKIVEPLELQEEFMEMLNSYM